jgi:orotidine-5'-phosphate decarboxylase
VHFADRLFRAVRAKRNAVVVGIDPRLEQLPEAVRERFPSSRAGAAGAIRAFGEAVIDVVAPLVPAVKFQSAFYEMYGAEGADALWKLVQAAQRAGLIAIVDGKRNDIGSTAEAYAQAYLGEVLVGNSSEPAWSADALTINPYLGWDGIKPFVDAATPRGRGAFVLVRTSNPSAGDLQDMLAGDRPVFQQVASLVTNWATPLRGESGYSLLGAVVGATYPEQLAELRSAMPGVPFLVPGYGAQGGNARDVAGAFDENGLGAVVNNSRGITFAYQRADLRERFSQNWQGAIEIAVREMVDALAQETPCKRL